MSVSARIARSLEEGRGGLVSGAVSRAWGAVAARALSRPLTFRPSARVVVIGGATLGGSGKTPLAIACAKALAELGHSVAFVGHAYRAHPGEARVVTPGDPVSRVGDEALVACGSLSRSRVPVVVAPSRQAALDLALSLADVAVLDGVAQLHPVRAHLSLLALDPHDPWGAGACPPSGDLRARPRDLLEVCDRVVVLGPSHTEISRLSRPVDATHVVSGGADTLGTRFSWDNLRSLRVGLWTSVARPRRLEVELASHGVHPRLFAQHADHHAVEPAKLAEYARQAREQALDLWLCTAKCATHMPSHVDGTRLATLEHEVLLEPALLDALEAATHRWSS